MNIAIGSDHGGLCLKRSILTFLEENGYTYTDFGIIDEASADYPDVALPVCEAILSGKCDAGILLCGTGIGMSIAANKVRGIRAAHCCDVFCGQMAREHNNANVIALGGRITTPADAVEIVRAYLHAGFQGGRHLVRVDKIMDIEKRYL